MKGIWAAAKPCPECKGTNLIAAQTTLGRLPLTFILCMGCGFKGPTSMFRDDAEGLWNAIPRGEGKNDVHCALEQGQVFLTIAELLQEAHETAVQKGWWDADRNFAELIALQHSELSEALEEWRARRGFCEVYYEGDKPCGIPIEFADLVIRVADTCQRYGIDLECALRVKMAYNKTRPHRHGGKQA